MPDVSQARKLIGDLRDDEQALDLFTRMVLHSAPAESRLLVVVDQFEEVFTYRPQDGPVRARFEQDRDQFFANLLHAAATPGGRVAVVLSMRSDFLGPCTSFERLNNVLNAHLIQVGPMREDELRAAIEQPAFKVGCELEPRLTERLLRDVEGQAGALPLLQFTLDEVWKRRDVRRLTLRAYTELGKDDRGQERGIEGVLDHRANEIYRNLTPENQDLCRRLFLRLVQPGEGTEVTKRRVSYRELLPDDPARAEVIRKLVQSLASRDARLITTEGTGATEGAIEVAHEALIRGWKQLRQWIDADREFLWSWDRLRATARYWEKEGRRRDLLLPEGRLLAEAEDLLLCHESELDPDGIAYARASITKNNRRGLYNWILLCSFLTIPTLLWGGHDLVSVDSARAAWSKTFQFHFNNNDVIWGSVAGIPFSIFPLWVTYRKWRGRPGFKTIYLDKVFWSINLALSLMIIIITSAMIYYNVISIHFLFIMVLYTVFAIVTAALLWDTARVDRYYRRRRDRLCTLEIVRKRSTLVSKAGLTFALFVLALADLFGLLALPSILERKNALELYQAHREIADYQIRDGQFGRALDSLDRVSR